MLHQGQGVTTQSEDQLVRPNDVLVRVERDGGTESIAGDVQQLSTSEVKFITAAPLRFAERVVLELVGTEEQGPCVIQAEVKLIQKSGPTDWSVTCSVREGAHGAAFEALVEKGYAERRQSPRIASDIYASIRWECTHDEFEASLVDISTEGCRLFVEENHDEALRLLISIRDQDQESLEVKAVKKWQRKIFEAWEVGCEFEGTINRYWVEKIGRSIGKEPSPSLSLLERLVGLFRRG